MSCQKVTLKFSPLIPYFQKCRLWIHASKTCKMYWCKGIKFFPLTLSFPTRDIIYYRTESFRTITQEVKIEKFQSCNRSNTMKKRPTTSREAVGNFTENKEKERSCYLKTFWGTHKSFRSVQKYRSCTTLFPLMRRGWIEATAAPTHSTAEAYN